jgi:hypothetical protein
MLVFEIQRHGFKTVEDWRNTYHGWHLSFFKYNPTGSLNSMENLRSEMLNSELSGCRSEMHSEDRENFTFELEETFAVSYIALGWVSIRTLSVALSASG